MPLPHNDVVKQKRLAESKLKRALSVLPRHSEERTEPTGVCSRRGIPHGRKGLILFVILSGATAQPKNLAVGA